MMVAEKAADLIAGNTPLPPSPAPYYRHGAGMPLYPEGDPRNSAWDAVTAPPSAAGAARAADAGRTSTPPGGEA